MPGCPGLKSVYMHDHHQKRLQQPPFRRDYEHNLPKSERKLDAQKALRASKLRQQPYRPITLIITSNMSAYRIYVMAVRTAARVVTVESEGVLRCYCVVMRLKTDLFDARKPNETDPTQLLRLGSKGH